MRITLNAAEIARACERYVRAKNTSDSEHHEYVVTMHWRAETADIDITPKPIPTLTDARTNVNGRAP